MVGEITYYKMTLKIGMDCRDTGLGWVLKKLRALLVTRDQDNSQLLQGQYHSPPSKEEEYEFPTYLDKKSKEFLILKTHLEDQLERLMEQKRRFVNEIGQSAASSAAHHNELPKANFNRTSLIGINPGGWTIGTGQDKIV